MEAGRLKTELGYVRTKPRSKAYRKTLEAEVEAMATFLGLQSGSWEIRG
ncbi:hypothetical protein [Luteolibacter marinus]|nr:hypothetical protein [Luteolibacter marinus]